MTNKTTTVTKAHTAARQAAAQAAEATTAAVAQLDAALAEQAAIDAEFNNDSQGDDLARRVAENASRVEALRRLVDRRRDAQAEAEEAAEAARRAVSVEALGKLIEDMEAWDEDAERERLLAAVRPAFEGVVKRGRALRDRMQAAGPLVRDAIEAGHGASASGASVELDGREASFFVSESVARDWLRSIASDAEVEAAAAAQAEAARRMAEAQGVQAAFSSAVSDNAVRPVGAIPPEHR